jgi:hypothetical protein
MVLSSQVAMASMFRGLWLTRERFVDYLWQILEAEVLASRWAVGWTGGYIRRVELKMLR